MSTSTRDLTKREVMLRQRATRMIERALPEQIATAYGTESGDPGDSPDGAARRDQARASLLHQSLLTTEELDTLSADQALQAAKSRIRDQLQELKVQADQQARDGRSPANARDKPPRTLRR